MTGRRVKATAIMHLPCSVDASTEVKEKLFSRMLPDELLLVARNDYIIVKYAEKLLEPLKQDRHKLRTVKQKVRQVCRFLVQARSESPDISDLASCLHPRMFNVIVSATRKLCGYQANENSFVNPSLAKHLGTALKFCSVILRNKALIEDNEEMKKNAENFFLLCESDWKIYVSSAAISTLSKRKWNAPLVLPFTEDIKTLSKHLESERSEHVQKLKDSQTPSAWHWYSLAKAVLASVILFNRKRSGEASRMTVDQFNSAKLNTTPNDAVLDSLSAVEKQLLKNFLRVEIPGKRGRVVPVLLTNDMVEEMNLLCSIRNAVRVNEANPYVFPRPFYNSEDHIAGHDCLRNAAEACHISNPGSITSTKLRKHIATVSQILNLKENELDQLCQFMGHDVRIHREFYRLPDSTVQLAKVSRLLVAIEQGRVSDFAGKSLEEIDVNLQFEENEIEHTEVHEERAESSDEEDFQGLQNDEVVVPSQEITESPIVPISTDGAGQGRATARQTRATARQIKATARQVQATASSETSPEPRQRRNLPQNQSRDYLTSAQLACVKEQFETEIRDHKLPGKADCETFLRKEPLLKGKSWTKIKATVRNEIEKSRRSLNRLLKH